MSTSSFPPYEKPATRNGRKKWIVFGALAALIALAVVGVAVGVSVSKKKDNDKSAQAAIQATDGGNSNNNNGNNNNNSNNPPSTPNGQPTTDPSVFEKDPNLFKSFYGMAYTPENSQLPNCGNNLEAVIKDIQLMSQLTNRLRLYGADCNQAELVMEAIKQTKVNMQVYLGNYPVPNDNNAAYIRQRDAIKAVIEKYGTEHIAGITVGNEFMLNYLVQNGGTQANSPIGDQGAAILIPNIQDTRDMLKGMNLNKNIPVGNSDAGSFFNNHVFEAIDYGMANVHAWFAHVGIEDAAQWTMTFFQQQDVDVANTFPNKPQMTIAETATANNGPADASEANLQIFLDTFVCQANQAGIGYFFFELFDEKWKDVEFGGVEGWWGLFHGNRTLKNIKIPNCPL
ncbi:glycoside hydrolase family 17 protein [Amanita thiersii Skay4041]|uniref:glucan endo-1,3-beta-D-glucosidase n=1 Tax=Amanita thiersii Skay4041 TaxID=703135 RepID=A0A2A9NPM2_9AGAR|nr:glycoside hydrolase family 17 protein [Amanita thiersii Skay4041]